MLLDWSDENTREIARAMQKIDRGYLITPIFFFSVPFSIIQYNRKQRNKLEYTKFVSGNVKEEINGRIKEKISNIRNIML
jgi:hypothetical protein